jgi:pyruvate,orthophosphate dikinase
MGMPLGKWVIVLNGGSIPDKSLIGGKAWSIAGMSSLGLNVPPAFVVTTRACVDYLSSGRMPEALEQDIAEGIAWLEERMSRRFGGGPGPLLVSVRSGAAVSMPGMMDTVLNLGITDETEAMLAAESGSPAFARDTHRRFLDLYARIVLKVPVPELRIDADPETWRATIASAAGVEMPDDVHTQLHTAVRAVFDSWNSPRARRYRKHQGISDDFGTAVTVQSMVFGNLDDGSGTGVLFTRNPITGEAQPYGEYLRRAQGEEIVSGSHTPAPLTIMRDSVGGAMDELLRGGALLEKFHRDVQDIEFTVERGRLYFLQTRTAKRSPHAAALIAVAMEAEGSIDAGEALGRVSADQIRLLLRPQLAPGASVSASAVARGEGASPGIGGGVVVSDPDEAEARARRGEDVVLARTTTSPNDLHGMISARATITEQGGATSHAAVVARALGRPCVVGCGADTVRNLSGRVVTVDGENGVVYDGKLPMEIRREEADPALARLIEWAAVRAPVKVETDVPAGVSVTDVDGLAGTDETDAIRTALASLPGGSCVRGAIFATNDDAVAAAVAAGVGVIVTSPRLPALLVALQRPAAKH